MEALEFRCCVSDCGCTYSTLQQLNAHDVLEHQSRPSLYALAEHKPEKVGDSLLLERAVQNIHTMTQNEIAQFLAKLDANCFNALLYRVYTIIMVEHWNKIK